MIADAWSRGMTSPQGHSCTRRDSGLWATLSQAGQPAVVPSWPGVQCTVPRASAMAPTRSSR